MQDTKHDHDVQPGWRNSRTV